ncbi:MAG: HEAT repeat domain-containing protein [Planctomycetes bacterium]|nr:HEAT repeat domain-containing protein [Planctomycetota bacterium]
MRIAAFGATLLLAFAACSTTGSDESPFQQPNSIMAGEIDRRMEQIPFQHREELLENLLWLAQTGEQTIPALLQGLRSDSAKVRSSAAWVLGRLRDHRTIPNLQAAMRDSDSTVRMEVARSLVLLGDLTWCPNLIEGLDSEKKEVRYMCHEALKSASGHDFGYDHLNQDQTQLRLSVLRWRQWWGEYSGDTFFAQGYQQKYNLDAAMAAPMGESNTMVPVPPMNPVMSEDAQPNVQQPQSDAEPMPNAGTDGSDANGSTDGSDANDGVEVTPAPQPQPQR